VVHYWAPGVSTVPSRGAGYVTVRLGIAERDGARVTTRLRIRRLTAFDAGVSGTYLKTFTS
jgi:hypothetical protein